MHTHSICFDLCPQSQPLQRQFRGHFSFSSAGSMCDVPISPAPYLGGWISGPNHSTLVRTQHRGIDFSIQSVRLASRHSIGCRARTGAVREKKQKQNGMTQVPPVPMHARTCTGCAQIGIHMRQSSAVFDAPGLVSTGKGASMHTGGEKG